MSEELSQNVNTSSAEFKEGVEAGLNSKADTKNWRAGNQLGQELKDEVENGELVPEGLRKESSTSQFTKNIRGDSKSNLQDEKDETEE